MEELNCDNGLFTGDIETNDWVLVHKCGENGTALTEIGRSGYKV